MAKTIAFQGVRGAYSDMACRKMCPGWETVPSESFSSAIQKVQDGDVIQALLPCENTLAGRVPAIHCLLPDSGLSIIGECFLRVEHCLMSVEGADLSSIKNVHSHPMALAQATHFLQEHHLRGVSEFDTAGAAQMVASWGKKTEAALASKLAAQLYGLKIIKQNVEDSANNITRFYLVSCKANRPDRTDGPCMTTMLFDISNKPGMLYQVLGIFARHHVNMTRLESYMSGVDFAATRFLVDVQGDPQDQYLAPALKQCQDNVKKMEILGVYPQSSFRYDKNAL